ncbi:nad dependent epimerase [Ophiostoma piceae UAMH 11346]|uniref:Nad dependent epimerase n=1 Tax=Ophiostoma piceae (strain UAMH 11346) TaxID=1262450 RepID=S3CPY2_OPHP1|nr:nad dependent epimerase [Ophiostoma piceae UAMH 11346]
MTQIFVAGITGCQGGAVAQLALRSGWSVHGLARNPAAATATALATQGVKLVAGDYDNTDALNRSLAGCTAVFIVPSPVFTDLTAELRWATAIVTAARSAGTVTSVVVSTSLGTEVFGDSDTSVFAQFMRYKRKVEVAVASSGIKTWTILRPGNFMANYLTPKVAMYPGFRETGVWTTGLLPDTQLPLVDEADIAALTVAAIGDPARFHEQTIGVASDVLTPGEIVAVLQEVLDENSGNSAHDQTNEKNIKRLKVAYLSDAELEGIKQKNPVIVAAYFMMRDMIGLIDVDAARNGHGMQMGTFRDYVHHHSENVKATYR